MSKTLTEAMKIGEYEGRQNTQTRHCDGEKLPKQYGKNKTGLPRSLRSLAMTDNEQRGVNAFRKRAAFTLAEVLITLGVIGVVAAMTIPNLVSNYQKRAWVAQLQKSYATLNQGFRRMLADDNATALSQTETFNSIGGSEQNGSNGVKYRKCASSNGKDSDNCKEFYRNLGKYFKIANIKDFTSADNYKYTFLNSNDQESYTGTVITLMDGTMIYRPEFYSQDPYGKTDNMMKGKVGYFYLDVNGTKRPNKMGRDIFYFHLGDNGIVYPYGSMAVSEYDYGNTTEGYWKTTTLPYNNCELDGHSYAMGCAARVLETGNMNYPKGNSGSGSGSGS